MKTFKLLKQWFSPGPLPTVTVKTPSVGIFTLTRENSNICLAGSLVEVKILEEAGRYYKISVIKVHKWTDSFFPHDKHIPSLVLKTEVEVIKWLEPTPPPQVVEPVPTTRKINV